MKRIHFVAAAFAAVHLSGVLLTAYYVSNSSAAQAPLVWVYWMFVDLPWSLLIWTLASGSLALLHGVIGTAWWYILVILVGKLIGAVRSKAARSRAS